MSITEDLMKAVVPSELDPCHCGRLPELKVTIGGCTLYYGIYCICGNSNRHYDSAIACIGVGIGNFPPQDKKTAIDDWNSKWRRVRPEEVVG